MIYLIVIDVCNEFMKIIDMLFHSFTSHTDHVLENKLGDPEKTLPEIQNRGTAVPVVSNPKYECECFRKIQYIK